MSDVVQGSDAWKQMRLGKVTASRIVDATAQTKTGWGASRPNYMAELIAERLSGVPADRFTNAAMQWGTENEAAARREYGYRNSVSVEEVPFVPHPRIIMSGASPDGLVGSDGLVEIKCPNTSTHIDTLLAGKVPGKYVTQMQWQMACTERAWCDFVSYDPRMPDHMSFFCKRVERDQLYISQLEEMISAFLAELEEKVSALTEKFGKAA
jgi:putative phage-type endonuclease